LVAPAMILSACVIVTLESRVGERGRRALRVVAMAATCLGACFEALIFQGLFTIDPRVLTEAARACVATAAGAGLVWSVRRGASIRLAVTASLLLLTAAALADQRTSWNRYVYGPAANDGLATFLAGAGHTYWEGDGGLELLWFRRGAPSYYSCVQGSESLFFRGMALDYARRGAALSRLDTANFAPTESAFWSRAAGRRLPRPARSRHRDPGPAGSGRHDSSLASAGLAESTRKDRKDIDLLPLFLLGLPLSAALRSRSGLTALAAGERIQFLA